jgi:tRNA pseudouridine55 synthase
MLGIALVDKPAGISSHDAIYRARRALGIRKIGHAGTLDPMASGLLVMAVGDATRFLPYLQTDPKTYVGEARLGVTTTTQDAEGEVVETRDAQGVTRSAIERAAKALVGDIEQIPPMYSAVKIGGERLYKLARKGKEVERAPRRVTVSMFTVTAAAVGAFSFEVVCSTGTYVRTLVHDLGERVGVGAHLTSLRRTRSGAFSVEDASAPNLLTESGLLTLEQALAHLPAIRLPEPQTERARHGNDFPFAGKVAGEHIALLDERGVFAVARRIEEGVWRPERALPPH